MSKTKNDTKNYLKTNIRYPGSDEISDSGYRPFVIAVRTSRWAEAWSLTVEMNLQDPTDLGTVWPEYYDW